ncbi:unnamed protein product [Cuscuta campestris]|uniref:DUF679 domain-containing protein n=1 Tax=Cuscuta campestris TaxID=132261 RepID=A0A484M9L0_9ASTE|nr:unnamed protein product [Cuscuta campestris]
MMSSSTGKNTAAAAAATATTTTEKAFAGIGNLIRLLPTGTVFAFEFLNPILTDNGTCSGAANKWFPAILIALCSLSCAFSCFTDSYTDDEGQTRYGIATAKGLWPPSASGSDTSAYRLRPGDFVHAAVTMAVFAVLVLLDRNTVMCYFPECESTQKKLLMVLPPVVGAVAGSVFVMFPQKRHGIGYLRNFGDNKAK